MKNEKHNKLPNNTNSIFLETTIKKSGTFKKMPPGISNRHKPAELFVDLIKTVFHGLETVVNIFTKVMPERN